MPPKRAKVTSTKAAAPVSSHLKDYQANNLALMNYTTFLDALELEAPKSWQGDRRTGGLEASIFDLREDAQTAEKQPALSRKLDALASMCVTHKEVVACMAKSLSSTVLTGTHVEDEAAAKEARKPKTRTVTKGATYRSNIARILITKNPHEPSEKDNGQVTEVSWKEIESIEPDVGQDIFDFFAGSWGYGKNKSFAEYLGVICGLLNKSIVADGRDRMQELIFFHEMSSTEKLRARFKHSESELNSCYVALLEVDRKEPVVALVTETLQGNEPSWIDYCFFALGDVGESPESLKELYQEEGFTARVGVRLLVSLINALQTMNDRLGVAIQNRKSSKTLRNHANILNSVVHALRWLSFCHLSTKMFRLISTHLADAFNQVKTERKLKKEANKPKRPKRMKLSGKFKTVADIELNEQFETHLKELDIPEEEKKARRETALAKLIAAEKEKSAWAEYTDEEGSDDEEVEAEESDLEKETPPRMDDNEDRPSIQDDGEDNEAEATQIRTWARMLTNSAHAGHTLATGKKDRDWLSKVQFELVEAKMPKFTHACDWPTVVTELFPNAADAKKVHRTLTKHNFSKFGKRALRFSGRVHCEALLCSLCFEVKNKNGLLQDEEYAKLAELSKFLEESPIGVSKRSCPVCFAVLDETYKYYGVDNTVSAGASHRFIFPCSMPPGLPLRVMEKVVKKFGGLLREELLKIMRAEYQDKDASPQSEPTGRKLTDAEKDEDEDLEWMIVQHVAKRKRQI
ncbi:hypothetical protein BJ508DRAFT_380319 [Ascobolus immersus RN42]|uniref:Uncharacterized protein n=1 Tax=Ascobolus immersus RN42 TaxID=1160509 RepID=A0A3N4HT13_ASCIM|nr:hypothetical protein BJ508DRAFT_380319 [Ascobolus immersus RN42]